MKVAEQSSKEMKLTISNNGPIRVNNTPYGTIALVGGERVDPTKT